MRSLLFPCLLLAGCDALIDIFDDDSGDGSESHVAGATSGRLNPGFVLDASVSGTGVLDELEVVDNQATLTLDGARYQGFAYTDQAWEGAGYHLFDLITVADDGSDLAIVYVYVQGSSVSWTWTESFVHPAGFDNVSGTASVSDGADTPVSAPALDVLPGAFDTGVAVQGGGLDLTGDGGTLRAGGTRWDWHPIATVDCTDCPGGPWLELHGLLSDNGEACFGILYLYPNDPSKAQLAYGICLPSLDPLGEWYEGVSW